MCNVVLLARSVLLVNAQFAGSRCLFLFFFFGCSSSRVINLCFVSSISIETYLVRCMFRKKNPKLIMYTLRYLIINCFSKTVVKKSHFYLFTKEVRPFVC